MIRAKHFVLLLTSMLLSMPALADTYELTFTPDSGSTGGTIAATGTFTSGPLAIDWGTDVFTLSASDVSEILSDCAPLTATLKDCASYSASDAGIYKPKLDVAPLLGIDDNGGSQTSFTLLASSANSNCAFEGCSSFGIISLADVSLASPVTAPEPGILMMLWPGMLGVILYGMKRLQKPTISRSTQS